jgi:hypothetical protein
MIQESPKRVTRFSADRRHRYTLWREWDVDSMTGTSDDCLNSANYCMFVGLNPSTADETNDDPTIRRCIQFAKDWGYGALCMTNIFAFRATDPKVMKVAVDPIGEENDAILIHHALFAGVVIAAWGTNGVHLFRNIRVKRAMTENGIELKCLRKTKAGHPEHPLYVPADTVPIPFPLA